MAPAVLETFVHSANKRNEMFASCLGLIGCVSTTKENLFDHLMLKVRGALHSPFHLSPPIGGEKSVCGHNSVCTSSEKHTKKKQTKSVEVLESKTAHCTHHAVAEMLM